MSNVNVTNSLYNGVVSGIGRFPVQFPDIQFINSVIITAVSGNVSPCYLGASGVTIQNGTELSPGLGVLLPLDRLSLLWGISPSGFTNELRWLGS